jgi:cytochrome c-type biogenesis protein CcmH
MENDSLGFMPLRKIITMTSPLRLLRSALFLLIWFITLTAPLNGVSAQDPQPTPSDNEVNRVAKQLFCPVCENIPLDVCPTQACHEWRELIRQKLAVGWSDDKIKEYFALQYGDRVLAEPPLRGLNLLVYLVPTLFILGGMVLLYVVLKRMRTTSAAVAGNTTTSEPPSPTDPYLAQVEDELKKRN